MNTNLAKVIDAGIALGRNVEVSKLGSHLYAKMDFMTKSSFKNFLNCGLFGNAKEGRENDYHGEFVNGHPYRIEFREAKRECIVTIY